MFKVAVICGGPSPERGISLNSARSVMDHLSSPLIDIVPFYVDYQKRFYKISPGQLYSNTPSDFDFKLGGKALEALEPHLREVDLVFPAIHGRFGDDGELQEMLEKWQIPFVGPSSQSCRTMFFKHRAADFLKNQGFNTWPSLVFRQGDDPQRVRDFWGTMPRGIVKPVAAGSSFGVYSVRSAEEALERLADVFKFHDEALVEPFCEGQEFTVIVLEGQALIPTEVAMSYEGNQIFDYRRKYLPTSEAVYHTPPRFSLEIIQEIRAKAEAIYSLFNVQDFARFDGWLMADGTIYFTDFNPITGLEQNSFFFRQTAVMGLTHREALRQVVGSACKRYGLELPEESEKSLVKEPVYVLFGGNTAERQVSLMSGTNVWLKLLGSHQFAPHPHYFDGVDAVWKLPYSYNLNHTVEEIQHNCLSAEEQGAKVKALSGFISHEKPIKMSLEEFLREAKAKEAFVFLALHGGEGENGVMQERMERFGLSYNGSGPAASALCMDKWETGRVITKLGHPSILSLPKVITSDLTGWDKIVEALGTSRVIIKPRADGCSAGIVVLQSAADLALYKKLQGATMIPPHSFVNQSGPVEMGQATDFIIEPYIEVDGLSIVDNQLLHREKEGWVELTVGVLDGKSLTPSITIAEGAVLSVEEKFQGGTGINVTPPPEEILSTEAAEKIKELVEIAAKALGITNYARLDIFFNRLSRKMIVIEANSLPALTPSTVLYHQGLAEKDPLKPTALLEQIIRSQKISFAV